MKLKKIVAVAAAAVLSLAMLTACGGGGGSSVPADGWTRKLITVEKNGQEVAEADAQVNYFTSSGPTAKLLTKALTTSIFRDPIM